MADRGNCPYRRDTDPGLVNVVPFLKSLQSKEKINYMPKNEPVRGARSNRSESWKNVVELSAETEDLLHQVMLMSNFSGPDEAFRDALRYYIDSQCGVEICPRWPAT